MPRLLFTSLVLFLCATLALAGATTGGPKPGTKAYNALPECPCNEGNRVPITNSKFPTPVPVLKIRGLSPDGELGLLHYPRAQRCKSTSSCA